METDEPFEVHGDIGCVGQSVNTGGLFSYATIWGDDPLSDEKDGLAEGDSFSIFPFPFENDAVYIVKSATLDTTWLALMDSLETALDSVLLVKDAKIDSLQGLVDNFPDLAAMQTSLDNANSRVTQLESDSVATDLQFGILVSRLRSTLNRLKN